MITIKTGQMHTSQVTHLAKKAKTVTESDGEVKTLYRADCQGMSRRYLCYLRLDKEPQEITCKKCLAKLAK